MFNKKKFLSFICACLPFLSSTGKSKAMIETLKEIPDDLAFALKQSNKTTARAFTVTPPKGMTGDLIKAALTLSREELEEILDDDYCYKKYRCHPFEVQKKWLKRLNYIANNKMKTLGYPALFVTGAGLTLYNREVITDRITNLIYSLRHNDNVEGNDEGYMNESNDLEIEKSE